MTKFTAKGNLTKTLSKQKNILEIVRSSSSLKKQGGTGGGVPDRCGTCLCKLKILSREDRCTGWLNSR